MRNNNFINRIKKSAQKIAEIFRSKLKRTAKKTTESDKVIHNEYGGMNKARIVFVNQKRAMAKRKTRRKMQKASRLANRK